MNKRSLLPTICFAANRNNDFITVEYFPIDIRTSFNLRMIRRELNHETKLPTYKYHNSIIIIVEWW